MECAKLNAQTMTFSSFSVSRSALGSLVFTPYSLLRLTGLGKPKSGSLPLLVSHGALTVGVLPKTILPKRTVLCRTQLHLFALITAAVQALRPNCLDWRTYVNGFFLHFILSFLGVVITVQYTTNLASGKLQMFPWHVWSRLFHTSLSIQCPLGLASSRAYFSFVTISRSEMGTRVYTLRYLCMSL